MSIKLLTADQVSEILGIKIETLRIWRIRGQGPVYRKIGGAVRYAESDVNAYIDGSARTSTSQKAPAQAAVA